MMAAHLRPAGAPQLWAARAAPVDPGQLDAAAPPWRTADVDSFAAPSQLQSVEALPGGSALDETFVLSI